MSRFVLAIETSTARGTVALGADGQLVEMREIDAARKNAAGLLPAIEATLAVHGVKLGDLAALAFSAGPGSFTGVRVAATVARMLNAVANVPIVKVPTLQAIAVRAEIDPRRPAHVAAILDAKRGQVFAAAYERADSEWVARVSPAIYDPVALVRLLGETARIQWLATGDGIAPHREILESAGIQFADEALWQSDAAAVVRAAWSPVQRSEFCPQATILPIYLRPPECEEVYESRREAAKAKRGVGVSPTVSSAESSVTDARSSGGAA
jgi:tRNA threonylcarbamoyladenosine biosynthesis protein TsaB